MEGIYKEPTLDKRLFILKIEKEMIFQISLIPYSKCCYKYLETSLLTKQKIIN